MRGGSCQTINVIYRRSIWTCAYLSQWLRGQRRERAACLSSLSAEICLAAFEELCRPFAVLRVASPFAAVSKYGQNTVTKLQAVANEGSVRGRRRRVASRRLSRLHGAKE